MRTTPRSTAAAKRRRPFTRIDAFAPETSSDHKSRVGRRSFPLRHDRRKTCYRIHALLDAAGLPAVKSRFPDASWREEMSRTLPAQRGLVPRTLLKQLDLLKRLTAEIEARVEKLVGERPTRAACGRSPASVR